MDTVCLNSPDRAFIRSVEDESGQVVSRCYQCGNCTAGCPMSYVFDYPVSRVMRLIQAGQREAVLSSSAIWLCATCETCTQRCPNNIDVAQVMDACRHMARREKTGSVYRVKTFFDSFVRTLGWFGRSHEIGVMAQYMTLTGRVWTDVDLAPAMLLKNKMPLLPHVIKGRKEVADIIRRFNEGASDDAVVRKKLAQDRASVLPGASVQPGGTAAAAPSVGTPSAPSFAPPDPSGVPAPSPVCGDSPTPEGWLGPLPVSERKSEEQPLGRTEADNPESARPGAQERAGS